MTKNRVKFSIQYKFFIILALIIVFICSALSSFFIIRSRSELYLELEKRGLTEVKSLAYDAKYGVMTEDSFILNRIIAGRINKPDIAYLEILGAEGTVLEKKTKKGYEFLYSKDNSAKHLGDNINRSSLITEKGEKVHEFTAAIITERIITLDKKQAIEDAILFTENKTAPLPLIAGTVKVGISLNYIDKKMEENISISVLLIFIVVSLSMFISYYFVKKLVRPIKLLTEASIKISKSDLTKSVNVNLSDEIGQLTTAFNKMTGDLQNSRDELVAEKEYLAVTLQSIGDGVIATDNKGNVVMLNGVAEGLTGWNR